MAGALSRTFQGIFNRIVFNRLDPAGAFVVPGVGYTPPANLYVALFTDATVPTDAAAGTEVAGGAYARVAVATTAAGWTCETSAAKFSQSDPIVKNTALITFPVPGATWGTIRYVGLYDAAVGGNYLGFAELIEPRYVANGDPAFTIPALTLEFSRRITSDQSSNRFGGFTRYFNNLWFYVFFNSNGGAAFDPQFDLHLGIFKTTTTPSDTGTGTEASGGGYARDPQFTADNLNPPVASGAVNWGDGAGGNCPIAGADAGKVFNNSAIRIPGGTFGADIGQCGYWFIADALAGGNVYWFGRFTPTSLNPTGARFLRAGDYAACPTAQLTLDRTYNSL